MSPKLRVIVISFAAVIAVYALFGFFLAPRLVRSNLFRAVEENLNATLSLDKVRVNPFTLALTLEGFSLKDDAGHPVASFDRLYVSFDLLSPIHRAWTLRELSLERPNVTLVILEDRTLRLTKLLKPRPPAPPAPADSAGAPPPAFHARLLRVVDGTLSYQDLSRTPAYSKTLIPMRIELVDFTTHRNDPNGVSFEASTESGERVAWHGDFRTRPFSTEGQFSLESVKAESIEEFLEDTLPFIVKRGTLEFGTRVRFDAGNTPATFELTEMAVGVEDFALEDRESGEEVIAATSIQSKSGTMKLTEQALDLGDVEVVAPRVIVWMDSTGLTNFQKWAKPSADSAAAAPWVTRISTARLTGLATDYQDRRLDPPAIVTTSEGALELADFSTAVNDTARLHATSTVGTSGRLAAEGTLVTSSAAIDVEAELADFDLQLIEPYVRVFAKVDMTSGTARAKGKLMLNSFGKAGPLLRFEGDAALQKFAMVDEAKRNDFLKWERLDLKGLEYDFKPDRTSIREVAATGAYARVVIAEDQTSNLQTIQVAETDKPAAFRKQVPSPEDSTGVTAANDSTAAGSAVVEPPLTEIGLVRVERGALDFSDLTLQPHFRAGIQDLAGTIRELSSAQAAHAAIELTGNSGPHAPVSISGTMNPLNSRGATDLTMRFENIELTTFTPYSGKFMGYPIERGKLDLDLHYIIENRQLQAENKFFMRQLTLGNKVDSPTAMSLPIKFAIALLKDKNGNIDLNLPVKGDLDDPKFSVMPIVWKLLVGLITKAVMSPFKLFGAIFGGDDEEVAPAIHFPFGSAEIDSTQSAKLDAIAKGLADRPAINLEVEESGSRAPDSTATFAARFNDVLRSAPVSKKERAPDPATIAAAARITPAGHDPAMYAERLARAYAANFKRAPPISPAKKTKEGTAPDSAAVAQEEMRLRAMEDSLRNRVVVSPEEVEALSLERARRIQGYILQRDSTVAAERIFIVANKGSYPPDSAGVRVGLTLRD